MVGAYSAGIIVLGTVGACFSGPAVVCCFAALLQVCLYGGSFSPDTAAPYDPQHGWEAAREALTAAASGLAGEPAGALLGAGDNASAAGDLSDSLQRLWLLVEATAALQGAGDVLSGARSDSATEGQGGNDKLSAALLTLFKVRRCSAGRGWGLWVRRRQAVHSAGF